MASEVTALINHFAREGFYRHIQTVCDEVVKKRGNDPAVLFWMAFGLAQEGAHSEAIRTIEPLQSKRGVELPVAMALLAYHNQADMPDLETVGKLEVMIEKLEERASDEGLLLGATFAWHMGNADRARELARRILSSNSEQAPALALLGWVDLTSSGINEAPAADSIDKFERALAAGRSSKKELEALTGAARYWELKGEYEKAQEMLDHVTGMYRWYLPAMTHKADIMTQMNEWERAKEFTDQVLSSDGQNIKALRLRVLYELTRRSTPADAAEHLGVLIDAIDRHEPRNAELFWSVSQAFARLSCRRAEILRLTMQLAQRASELDPMSSKYLTEVAYQQQLMGEYEGKAVDAYRRAAGLDDTNVQALYGSIYCQLAENQLDDAEAQLEFLTVIHESIGRSAQVSFLEALLQWRKHGDKDGHIRLLEETKKLHFADLKAAQESSLSNGTYDFYVRFNPDFMVEVVREYMLHVGSEPLSPTEGPNPALTRARQLLQKVVKVVPGQLDAQTMLATVRYLTGDFEEASRVIGRCLELDSTHAEAHLLAAQIDLKQDHYRSAMASLDQALSHNFKVRESPVYHLVRAEVLEGMGETESALATLEKAMGLPGVKMPAREGAAGVRPLSTHDRASIFIKLAELHTKLNRIPEATKAVSDAMHEFAGTPEEVRVIVANSEIALKRGDADTAVRLLGNVPSKSPAFAKAQMVKADIYLKHRRDQDRYIKCYRDMVTKAPTEHNYVLLGDAYLRIQMPDEAIEAFEEALSKNPEDARLSSKIGQALVSTHDYLRAITYYEQALRSQPGNISLRSDLTKLYVKLNRFAEAGRLLDVALAESNREDAHSMVHTVDNYSLMAEVHKGNGNIDDALDHLIQACKVQQQLVSRLRSEAPDDLREARMKHADLYFKLAKMYEDERQDTKAEANYNEALRAHSSHEASMLALARAFLRKGDFDGCQRQCVTLMRVDPSNVEASMMLADLMFRKNESDAATYHFQQLLDKKPRHYEALAKLISLLKRAGKLDDAPRFISVAERSSPRARHEAGFRFCKGLLERYRNNSHEAIKHFNSVRQDGRWGDAATEHMVEIYLALDESANWAESDSKDMEEGIRIAEKLLKELPNHPLTPRQKVLQAYTLIATKNKSSIDAAMGILDEILSADKEHVPSLLALATALVILKQTPKARNHLKRIARMTYNQDVGDEFVKSWLLLSDVFINSGKYDMAQELCKRCLSYDRSCAKAWEYMGWIMEKEHAYKDAADHYEQAWSYMNESSAPIGYKLAFNYLKAERFVEAITVCHKVLHAFPDYPKIRKDVLDRARAGLRP